MSLKHASPEYDLATQVPRTLCQPPSMQGGEQKSCGACCGMYNQRDELSSHHTLARLRHRTLAYFQTASIHDEESLQRFRAIHEPTPDQKLLDGLPSCPFLGLLNASPQSLEDDASWLESASRSRVGCLVHPLQNHGTDGRDCGVYDRTICEGYLCAAHDVMKTDEKWLVLTAIKDSYLYGLVITDTRFVRELFEAAAHINGAYPSPRFLRRVRAVHAAKDFFELKRDWPYRHPVDGIFGQVIPVIDLETRRRPGPSESLGLEPDPLTESILRCLGTHVSTREQLDRARAVVRERIDAFARAVAFEPDEAISDF